MQETVEKLDCRVSTLESAQRAFVQNIADFDRKLNRLGDLVERMEEANKTSNRILHGNGSPDSGLSVRVHSIEEWRDATSKRCDRVQQAVFGLLGDPSLPERVRNLEEWRKSLLRHFWVMYPLLLGVLLSQVWHLFETHL